MGAVPLAVGRNAPGVLAKSRRLSVLLLLTDDQGAHMSCLGTRGIQTPHMDRLADRGVRFDNAFAASPSCAPSRSSILTGMYPHSHGHWRNTLNPRFGIDSPGEFGRHARKVDAVGVHEDVPTLIELLNEQGYFTGITQKFHLSPPWKYPFHVRLFGHPRHRTCSSRPESHFEAAKEFFNQCGDRPFFLMANVVNTHRPFKRHIAPLDIPPVDPEAIRVPSNFPDTPALRRDLAEYFDTVQSADACVGALLEALHQSGRFEETLILFTSDHGYPYHRAKGTVYDAGVRIPLVISGPGIPTGRRINDLVSHLDLVPTILDSLEKKVPESVQGQTLGPLLEGRVGARGHELVFSESHRHMRDHPDHPTDLYPCRGVTDGRMRYIRNLMPELEYVLPPDLRYEESWDNHSYQATVDARQEFPIQYELLQQTLHRPAEELYDLHADPAEIRNLVDHPGYAVKLRRLQKAMDEWMKETNDPGDPRKIVRRG